MYWQLYYLKKNSEEKRLEYERDFEDGELDLINECKKILGDFNSFSDYYIMLKHSLSELKEYLLNTENFNYRLKSPLELKNVIIEANRKFINFASMFRTFLDYYEVQVNQIYGNPSDELKEFKRRCSKYFDKYFENRFLYNLRHYCVHYKVPITKITQNVEDKRRVFYIDSGQLKNWNVWKPIIKNDIENLEKDIDIKEFIKKIESILNELNKDISYFNTSEVLGAIRIMKKYCKSDATPYIAKKVEKGNGQTNFEIKNMIDDFVLAENNIINLGIFACGVFNKEYGFQFFDPFNIMFAKEESVVKNTALFFVVKYNKKGK